MPNRRASLQCPTTKYLCSVQPLSNYPCSAQAQRIPAMPNHQVSLQCPTTQYPCSAQLQGIPAMLNQVSLQCPITAQFPCSDLQLLQSIPAAPNSGVSLQCPWQRIPAVCPNSISAALNGKVSLSCPALAHADPHSICPCSVKLQNSCSAFAVLQGRQFRAGGGNIAFLVQ